MSIESQPKFIKIKILNQLSLEDLLKLRTLNKSFNKFIQVTAWRHKVKILIGINSPITVKEFIQLFAFVKYDFSYSAIKDKDLEYLKNCKYINLSNTHITNKGFQVFVLNNPGCEKVILNGTKLSLPANVLKYCKKLELEYTKVSESEIINFLSNNKVCKSLNLCGTNITDACSFAFKRYFKNLNLSTIDVTDKFIDGLRGESFENLEISSMRITREGLTNFIQGNSCKSLNISGMKVKIGSTTFLNCESIDLSFTKLTDAGMSIILENCKLKSLNVSYTKITDVSIINFGNTYFDYLNLRKTAVTNEGFSVLRCKSLSIDFTEVGDKGLIAFAKNNKNCKKINLSRTRVTNVGIIAFAQNEQCKNISLSVTKVKDESIIIFAKNNPKLRSINLLYTKVTDKSVFAIIENCKNCRKINLCGTKITDASIKLLNNFTHLNLKKTNITDISIIALCTNYKLFDLDLSGTKVTDYHVKNLNCKILKIYNVKISLEIELFLKKNMIVYN